MDQLSHIAIAIAIELALFAAVVFAVFGAEDLLIDALRISNLGKGRGAPVDEQTAIKRRFAIFIPAWSESAVIGAMLETASHAWKSRDIRIYVGVYPNDLSTLLAARDAAAHDIRIQIVINREAGPTTKGACLNRLWQACTSDLKSGAFATDAVLIHDAEDVVDAAELIILSEALNSYDYAQLPVVPITDPRSRWISGHYCDEFAEAHGKDLPVRSALGLALPLAGVGCAFRIDALMAMSGGTGPFCADSLTEDYELGLRLSAAGARGTFARRWTNDGRLVASRGYFPSAIDQAVRQKTRWLRGISFDAWDRLGWITMQTRSSRQHIAGLWMLWRDRRTVLAAVAILCGYSGVILMTYAYFQSATMFRDALNNHPAIVQLFAFNLLLLIWRLIVRCLCVGRVYGWPQVFFTVLRTPIGNILLVMTAWRAVLGYMRGRRGETVIWDKTEHHFPTAIIIENTR